MAGVTDGPACAVAVESGSLVGSVDSPCFSSNCTPASKSRRLLVDVACITLLLLGIFALVALSLSYNPSAVRVIGSVVEVAVYWTCDEGRGGRTAIPQLFPQQFRSSSAAAPQQLRSSSAAAPQQLLRSSSSAAAPQSFRVTSAVVPCYLLSRSVLL